MHTARDYGPMARVREVAHKKVSPKSKLIIGNNMRQIHFYVNFPFYETKCCLRCMEYSKQIQLFLQ